MEDEQRLLRAAQAGAFKRVQNYLEERVNPNAVDYLGRTALHFASEKGHDAIVQLLLDKRASLSAVDTHGCTPLHSASENGHKNVVKLLLERRATVNARDGAGWTPLLWASRKMHYDIMELLLEKEADVHAKAVFGWTPLHWVSDNGHEKAAELLLSKKAQIDENENEDLRTPLHLASKNGHVGVVLLLLAKEANMEATDCFGWTPLYLACRHGHERVVVVLLASGANANVKDKRMRTPLDAAQEYKHNKVVTLLLEGRAALDNGMHGLASTNPFPAAKAANEGVAKLAFHPGNDERTKMEFEKQKQEHYGTKKAATVELAAERTKVELEKRKLAGYGYEKAATVARLPELPATTNGHFSDENGSYGDDRKLAGKALSSRMTPSAETLAAANRGDKSVSFSANISNVSTSDKELEATVERVNRPSGPQVDSSSLKRRPTTTMSDDGSEGQSQSSSSANSSSNSSATGSLSTASMSKLQYTENDLQAMMKQIDQYDVDLQQIVARTPPVQESENEDGSRNSTQSGKKKWGFAGRLVSHFRKSVDKQRPQAGTKQASASTSSTKEEFAESETSVSSNDDSSLRTDGGSGDKMHSSRSNSRTEDDTYAGTTRDKVNSLTVGASTIDPFRYRSGEAATKNAASSQVLSSGPDGRFFHNVSGSPPNGFGNRPTGSVANRHRPPGMHTGQTPLERDRRFGQGPGHQLPVVPENAEGDPDVVDDRRSLVPPTVLAFEESRSVVFTELSSITTEEADRLLQVENQEVVDSNGGHGVYTGMLLQSTGMPHGLGRMKYDDGQIYDGVWSNGRWNGLLKVENQGLEDSQGDEGLYTGTVLQSTRMPHGVGRMKYDEDGHIYEGSWSNGCWNGRGRTIFSNGDLYEGQYRYHQRHGRGIYRYNDGGVYDGHFSENRHQGHGMMTWPDGSTYKGEFVSGLREGSGRYVFSDGRKYEGSWKEGRFDGFGTSTWNDGRCYKGEWRKGMAHGKGVETYPDGRVRHDGQWLNDQPVRST